MDKSTACAALVAALCAVALTACDREDMQRADRAGAEVGRKADAALEKSKDALSRAGHRAGEAFSEAGKRLDQATSVEKPAKDGEKPASEAARPGSDAAKPDDHRDTGKQARAALSDAAITASIRTDILKDPDLSVLKVDVATRDGVVTLDGQAASGAARERATKIAEGTKGVREVKNRLAVKPA